MSIYSSHAQAVTDEGIAGGSTTSTRSGPTTSIAAPVARPAHTTTSRTAPTSLEPMIGTLDTDYNTHLGQYIEPEQSIVDFDPNSGLGYGGRQAIDRDGLDLEAVLGGTFLPAAYFRTVRGVCVDTDGKPIKKGEYLLAFGGLPTVGEVNDAGEFTVPVLKNTYTDFVLVTSSGRKGVDYAWFSPVDTRVPSYQDEAILVFERRELTGLYAGEGTQMGGSLR